MRKSLVVGRFMTVAALLLAFSTPGTLGGTSSAAPKDSPWGENYFPNVPLVTHDGKTVRFYDDLIKDKKVLINFIYAGCEKACPLATARLVQVQKLLGPRVGRDIFIYSITLDPEHDTPRVLKEYAEKYGAGPGWLFLTGRREEIDAVRFKLGERGEEKEDHNNLVRVGDGAKGQWMRLPLFGDLNFLVVEIGKTLDPNWYAGKPVESYAEAPRLKIPEPGQVLFQTRCALCHTLGEGDLLGPDLKGVTARRERVWLARFIAAPDRMRASKDSIAVELFAKYNMVSMPNLGLTGTEVADLINYLEAQTTAGRGSRDASGNEKEAPRGEGQRQADPGGGR
ncbi:MAG: SCO family protein [Candidatus Tectomicrobia bacterium]|uniref:SCO family protein n=1 Tax=Tectimicrobiota bacterium TaxID=2528274 RepID=A0A932CR49_UNCTE|nr:SCO family protein [Candidatus Tectomicrobia bacterium]